MNAGSTVCDNRSEDGCCFSNFGQIFQKNRQAKREANKEIKVNKYCPRRVLSHFRCLKTVKKIKEIEKLAVGTVISSKPRDCEEIIV